LGNFRQIIKTPKLEFCELVKNAYQNEGPFSKMTQSLMNSSSGAIHVCPYEIGPFNIYNYTNRKSDLSFVPIPSGDYKAVFKFSRDDDPQMGNISVKVSIKTDFSADFK